MCQHLAEMCQSNKVERFSEIIIIILWKDVSNFKLSNIFFRKNSRKFVIVRSVDFQYRSCWFDDLNLIFWVKEKQVSLFFLRKIQYMYIYVHVSRSFTPPCECFSPSFLCPIRSVRLDKGTFGKFNHTIHRIYTHLVYWRWASFRGKLARWPGIFGSRREKCLLKHIPASFHRVHDFSRSAEIKTVFRYFIGFSSILNLK